MRHEGRCRRSRLAVVAIAVALLALAGCEHAAASQRVSLSVFAASSLTESFREIEVAFERAHPDVDVGLTLAGSQVLRLQIEHGANADVFASANSEHLDALVSRGAIGEHYGFARNELVVIVPKANTAAIDSFDDLPRARRLVIGADHVPVGRYTREVFERARARLGHDFVAALRPRIVSEESNVRLVRAKVALGEADAAIVYRTDTTGVANIRVVPIPEDLNVHALYSIGATTSGAEPELASRFIAFLRAKAGREILQRHGFRGP